VIDTFPPPGVDPDSDIRVAYIDGRSIHALATPLLWVRLLERYPGTRREERFLSGDEGSHDVEVDYPAQGQRVLGFLAAPVGDEVHVWDLWPGGESVSDGLAVLDRLDPRAPDLATRHGRRPVPGTTEIQSMTLYYPRVINSLGGYWLSIFSAHDARRFQRPDEEELRDEPGFLYYREYYETTEPPFRIDAYMPPGIEVSAPGIYPGPEESIAGSLFPAPVRVSGPGVLPEKDSQEPKRIVRTSGPSQSSADASRAM
jgi:hypothetical protein